MNGKSSSVAPKTGMRAGRLRRSPSLNPVSGTPLPSHEIPVTSRRVDVILAMIRLARPEQWIKNVIVVMPVIFGGRMQDLSAWVTVALAAVAFSFASGAVYVMNDAVDRERDRNHPQKCKRPLAAGIISLKLAAAEGLTLLLMSSLLALAISPSVVGIILTYVVLQSAYSLRLKHRVIVDVMCIAIGFVLRAAAGALAIHVEVSPWLVICTFTMCLFMGFCKRRSEIATLQNGGEDGKHRRTLDTYNPEVLTHLTTLSAAVAVISYFLYATSPRTVEHFGMWILILNSPAVVYGVFRFALMSIQGRYPGPTELILHDRPFQASALCWIVSVCVGLLWLGQL